MFLSKAEIAQITGEPETTIYEYMHRLRKTVSNLPPDEMSQEALYGYVTMSDTMLQDMMQFYSIMREDFDIGRSNIARTDGKRTMKVQPKDMIALMQTLMKTQLERAAVLSKFAAVGTNSKPLANSNSTITSNMLMNSKAKEIEVEVIDVEFTDAN